MRTLLGPVHSLSNPLRVALTRVCLTDRRANQTRPRTRPISCSAGS
jgi:hypothetical protein